MIFIDREYYKSIKKSIKMERKGRYEADIPKGSRSSSLKKGRIINVENSSTGDSRQLSIQNSWNVKQLKKEIEKLFNLSFKLDNRRLKLKTNGMPQGIVINQDDENKTLLELGFTSFCFVFFGNEQNVSGIKYI